MKSSRHPVDPTLQSFFEKRVESFFTPLEKFVHKQTTAALLLALATVIALFLANSSWAGIMKHLAELETGVVFDRWQFLLPVKEWIGSGFMALFFFLIGLELKRETLAGRLRHPQQISLIIMAALGGMILPALIYWGINHGTAGAHGWAIPMATDTAFAIGVLALLARKVSYGISIFLTAMAIFDDIGAIAILSLFYAHDIQIGALLLAIVTLAALFFVNVAGVRSNWIYGCLGLVLWLCVYHSGIHATLAGLLLAITIPARTRLGQTGFLAEVKGLVSIFETKQQERHRLGLDEKILGADDQHSLTTEFEETIRAASTPLQRWETFLIYPIGIIVLPLFALFNAGVALSGHEIAAAMQSPVTIGIIAGLVIGKPLGVALFVYAGLFFNIGKLPEGMRFTEVIGVGLLGGIGFTMSLFVAMLGFEHAPQMVDSAKTGIIFASLISATLASLWIILTYHYRKAIIPT
ncbi:MAG: Na+/H+ antiporter NhaA [Alphaproteobacteria bacterium]|jgi:NhaA family Na+:H+ antiporter|nr:Na+/H+ antiporter NhaA [Alphaproteobacteria bacterium]MDP7223430.1 Na+/H+ antiporter NhaA [Alphaproteobacteria bacterium]